MSEKHLKLAGNTLRGFACYVTGSDEMRNFQNAVADFEAAVRADQRRIDEANMQDANGYRIGG